MNKHARHQGMTLIETLVALLIFGIVAMIATSGVINALRVQGVNEAAASAQAKLRRVVEVFTQELRSAVLGGVSNQPYASGSSSISFLLLDGGAGYQVLPHDSGGGFPNSVNFEIIAPGSTAAVQASLAGQEIMLINGNGDATVLQVTNVTSTKGPGSGIYRVVHNACANTIAYTPNSTLVMLVSSLGMNFDSASGNLNQISGSGAEVPLAFDLDGLELEYVYLLDDGSTRVRAEPYADANGYPVRRGKVAGENVSLVRIQLTVSATELSGGGRSVSRSYTGQVELASNPSFRIDRVVPCRP